MPRRARVVAGGVCYHVINRANQRTRIFHCADDYRYFVLAMARVQERLPVEIFSACIMPNHVHLVVRPRGDDDLPHWMQRLMTTHVRWHHQRHETTGRLWQDRYKAFPIEQDRHLVTVMRYVERNAARAGLVRKAEDWPWSSLAWTGGVEQALLSRAPVILPRNWCAFVNMPLSTAELDAIRTCVNRQRPYGSDSWVQDTARRYDLGSTLTPRGRPHKIVLADSATVDLFDAETMARRRT